MDAKLSPDGSLGAPRIARMNAQPHSAKAQASASVLAAAEQCMLLHLS